MFNAYRCGLGPGSIAPLTVCRLSEAATGRGDRLALWGAFACPCPLTMCGRKGLIAADKDRMVGAGRARGSLATAIAPILPGRRHPTHQGPATGGVDAIRLYGSTRRRHHFELLAAIFATATDKATKGFSVTGEKERHQRRPRIGDAPMSYGRSRVRDQPFWSR